MSFATTTNSIAHNNVNGNSPIMTSAVAISRQRTPTPHSTKQGKLRLTAVMFLYLLRFPVLLFYVVWASSVIPSPEAVN